MLVLALCSACGAGVTSGRSSVLSVQRAPDAGASVGEPWAVVAVPLVREREALRAVDGHDGVARWTFGPLRVALDREQLVVVGEAPRAAIVSAAPSGSEGGWLFVTEDGAAWTARSFDGALRRLATEAGTRVQPLAGSTADVIALESSDHSAHFATSDGVVRAPESIAQPLLAAGFASVDRGWVIEQPGRLLEVTQGGRSVRPIATGEDAALALFVRGPTALVRTARRWMRWMPGDQWSPAAAPSAPFDAPTIGDRARWANALSVSAASEPTRGRALALSLGAVMLRSRTIAMLDRSGEGDALEALFVREDGVASRVRAPCAEGELHPFGERAVLACRASDATQARYFIGDERGFQPLGDELGTLDPARVHVAPDGSAIVIERACHANVEGDSTEEFTQDHRASAVLCVLDHGHAPRPALAPPELRVVAVRAGRALFEHPGSRLYSVAELRALREPAVLRQSPTWRSVTLGADGSVMATVGLGEQRSLVMIAPDADAERNEHAEVVPLPPRVTRVASIDRTRLAALSHEPTQLWLSDDRGAHWRAISLGIHGASSTHALPAADAPRRSASPLGRVPSMIDGQCSEYACVFDEGLVLADPRWLRAPALEAAQSAPDAIDDEPERRDARALDEVLFCGEVAMARGRGAPGARVAHPDDPWGGEPGSRGWLAVDQRANEQRFRWISVDDERLVRAQSAWSATPAMAPSSQASSSSVRTGGAPTLVHSLRLATRAYAIVQRCDGPACDLLFVQPQRAPRVLTAPGDWLAGADLAARLQLAERVDEQRFALWISSASEDTGAPSSRSIDALLLFDTLGALQARRSWAWAAGTCSMRAMAFSDGELGLACGRDEAPGELRFFGIRGGAERTIAGLSQSAATGCVEQRAERAWMVSQRWAPLVYARGRTLPYAQGAHARWALRPGGACLTELRLDTIENARASVVQQEQQASLRLRSSAAERGGFHLDWIGRTGIERASCTHR